MSDFLKTIFIKFLATRRSTLHLESTAAKLRYYSFYKGGDGGSPAITHKLSIHNVGGGGERVYGNQGIESRPLH